MKTQLAAATWIVLVGCTSEIPVADGINGASGASHSSGVAGATNPASATLDRGTIGAAGAPTATVAAATANTGAAEAEFAAQLIPRCRQLCQTIVTCPVQAQQSCACSEASAGGPVSPSGGAATNAQAGVAGSSSQSQDAHADPASGGVQSSSCGCTSSGYLHLDECLGDCLDAFGPRFLYKGEDCAKVGTTLLSCYANLDCSFFIHSTNDLCEAPATIALCPRTATQGSDAVDVAPRTNAPCGTGTSGGKAGVVDLANLLPNEQICSASFDSCTGSTKHGVSCRTGEDLSIECQCLVDDQVQSTFDGRAMLEAHPQIYRCDDDAWIEPSCGWKLSS